MPWDPRGGADEPRHDVDQIHCASFGRIEEEYNHVDFQPIDTGDDSRAPKDSEGIPTAMHDFSSSPEALSDLEAFNAPLPDPFLESPLVSLSATNTSQQEQCDRDTIGTSATESPSSLSPSSITRDTPPEDNFRQDPDVDTQPPVPSTGSILVDTTNTQAITASQSSSVHVALVPRFADYSSLIPNPRPARSYLPRLRNWSNDELWTLATMYAQGFDFNAIGTVLDRTPSLLNLRISKLRVCDGYTWLASIPSRQGMSLPMAWSFDDDEELRRRQLLGEAETAIAQALGRSRYHIRKRLLHLHLK